ncbi:MAG: peptide deformylase [Patescibacteria group bacterium]
MIDIIQNDNPTLREICKTISLKDISSEKIQNIIIKMKKALNSQEDGVAIAAPQIGEAVRMFIVSDNVMKLADESFRSSGKDLVFINPEIIKLSRNKQEVEEGCLSVRWKYGKVKRSMKATVRGYNELGELVERGASGLLAQIFQHETDHLDGILFIDKAHDILDIPPEKIIC